MNEEEAKTVDETEGEVDVFEKIEATTDKLLTAKEINDEFDDEAVKGSKDNLSAEEKRYIERGRLSESKDIMEKAFAKYPEADSERGRERIGKMVERLIKSNAAADTINERIYADARRFHEDSSAIKSELREQVKEQLAKEREELTKEVDEKKSELEEKLGKPVTGGGQAGLNTVDAINSAKNEAEVLEIVKKVGVETKTF